MRGNWRKLEGRRETRRNEKYLLDEKISALKATKCAEEGGREGGGGELKLKMVEHRNGCTLFGRRRYRKGKRGAD